MEALDAPSMALPMVPLAAKGDVRSLAAAEDLHSSRWAQDTASGVKVVLVEEVASLRAVELGRISSSESTCGKNIPSAHQRQLQSGQSREALL